MANTRRVVTVAILVESEAMDYENPDVLAIYEAENAINCADRHILSTTVVSCETVGEWLANESNINPNQLSLFVA